MKPLSPTLLLLLSFLCAPIRSAQAQTDATPASLAPEEARRRTLFQEGKDAFRARKWELAFTKLTEAWKLRRSFDVALVLAQAEYKVNRFAESAEHFAYYLRFVSAKENQDIIANAREALAAAKLNVATVRLVAPKGAEITVDGRSVGTAPLDDAVFAAPGKRVFEAKLGDAYVSKAFDLAIATEQELELVFPPSAPKAVPPASPASGLGTPPPTEEPPPAPRSEPPSYAPPAIAAAVGGVALVTGVVLLVVAGGKDSDREGIVDKLPGTNRCGNRPERPSECDTAQNLANDARTFRAISYASFALALGAGVATYLLWPTQDSRKSARHFVPTLATDGAGISLGAMGRF